MSAPITELIDTGTVQGIADEVWVALLGADEYLVPMKADFPDPTVSAWVTRRRTTTESSTTSTEICGMVTHSPDRAGSACRGWPRR